jgi:hypothetical protein
MCPIISPFLSGGIYIQCMYIVQKERHTGGQTDTSETDSQAAGKQAGRRGSKVEKG